MQASLKLLPSPVLRPGQRSIALGSSRPRLRQGWPRRRAPPEPASRFRPIRMTIAWRDSRAPRYRAAARRAGQNASARPPARTILPVSGALQPSANSQAALACGRASAFLAGPAGARSRRSRQGGLRHDRRLTPPLRPETHPACLRAAPAGAEYLRGRRAFNAARASMTLEQRWEGWFCDRRLLGEQIQEAVIKYKFAMMQLRAQYRSSDLPLHRRESCHEVLWWIAAPLVPIMAAVIIPLLSDSRGATVRFSVPSFSTKLHLPPSGNPSHRRA